MGRGKEEEKKKKRKKKKKRGGGGGGGGRTTKAFPHFGQYLLDGSSSHVTEQSVTWTELYEPQSCTNHRVVRTAAEQ